jgi:hypothetical protein
LYGDLSPGQEDDADSLSLLPGREGSVKRLNLEQIGEINGCID